MTESVYTETVVANLVARYSDVVAETYESRSAVVKELADELKVSVASVRAKLSREGVYVAKEVATGTTRGMSKEDYVKALEAISGESLTSFTKATKKDLKSFWDYVVKASDMADANKTV